MTANAQKNGTADSTATITWNSSDTSIATIDSIGKVTFLKTGNVTFTATWTQQNKTATITVTVTQAAGAGTCVVTHNNGNVYATTDVCNLREGGTPMPFNAVFKDASGNAITGLTPEWSLSLPRFFGDKEVVQSADIIEYRRVAGYATSC